MRDVARVKVRSCDRAFRVDGIAIGALVVASARALNIERLDGAVGAAQEAVIDAA